MSELSVSRASPSDSPRVHDNTVTLEFTAQGQVKFAQCTITGNRLAPVDCRCSVNLAFTSYFLQVHLVIPNSKTCVLANMVSQSLRPFSAGKRVLWK